MKSFAVKFPRVAHMGHRVSHAKNRRKHAFKYNLRTVTVIVDGAKQRFRVPARMVRTLKRAGVTAQQAITTKTS